jgi:hypothetical protein
MKITLLQNKGNVEAKDFQKQLDIAIRKLIANLSATATFSSFTNQGWTTLSVDGEDTEVVIQLLSRTLGVAIVDASKTELYGNYRGIVKDISSSGIAVDIGIEHPKPTFVNVKLSSLQAQLADGQKISSRRITEPYCISPGTPISIRVTLISPSQIEGWLSDSQISLFSRWILSGLERIQVINCLPTQLDFAIRKAQLARDTIASEQLSLIVQSVLCKFGTNAIGLIPRIGSLLRKCELKPFIPRRIQEECRTWRTNDS